MRIDTSEFDKLMRELAKVPSESVKQAGGYFKGITPKRTGNARNKTVTNERKSRIEANYPYAGRLDEGYSKQAPKGMSDPTIDYLENIINSKVGRL